MGLVYMVVLPIYFITILFNLTGFIKNWRVEKTDFIVKGYPRPFEGYVLVNLILSPVTMWYWWYSPENRLKIRERER